MLQINYKALVVATLAAFVFSSLYYSPLLLRNTWNELRGIQRGAAASTPVWKPILEFARTFIVALVFTQFIARLGISDWKTAIVFGLGIWLCFPVMILLGSVMWENVPLGVAAIHAGDWLAKALFFSVVFSKWDS